MLEATMETLPLLLNLMNLRKDSHNINFQDTHHNFSTSDCWLKSKRSPVIIASIGERSCYVCLINVRLETNLSLFIIRTWPFWTPVIIC